ncbi:SMC family ATPase [Gleimia sp. 6138-11-ORH1]|uniref:AAA family ATPase n=1 Tax=Gleimia sp. 6138-11-ORH1 TaxID=2973937 RepID=UPI002169B2CD|nr:SMC family ATPase [Gleimia sp. 6138-11-ORH1]MCS4484067.1 SMC family ATPase [Gleimia sp. 6138-11-ORH1]
MIELNFAALGPFAKEYRIRFADFEASGLFLLRGATGSGKSSIIDAILFALYGESPLKETSSAQRLRSNFASKDTASYAELLFEVPSGAYLVRRTPRYRKPGNKNATAGTAVLEKVSLVDDQIVGREPLGAKPAEVNALIPQLLGIESQQFLQTVVLPQGKFAQFVRATPDSRKQLLQQIFRTQEFDRFTECLKDKAKQAKADYELLVTKASFLTSRILVADTSELALSELLPASQSRLDSLEAKAASFKAEKEHFETAVAEVKLLLKEVSLYQQVLDEFAEISAEKVTLEKQSQQMEVLRHQLQLAKEANPVVAVLTRVEESQAKLSQLFSEVSTRFNLALDVKEVDLKRLLIDSEAKEAELSQQLKEKTRQLNQHRNLLEKETQLEAQVSKCTELDALITTHETKLAAADEPLKRFAETVASLKESAATKQTIEKELLEVERRLESSRKADQKRSELVQCAEEIGRLNRLYFQAERDYEIALRNWESDAASQLAQELAPGVPCLVCGSEEHPALAEREKEFTEVSATDLANCMRVRNQAKVDLDLKKQQQKEITAQIVELNQLANAPTGTLESLQADYQADLRELEANVQKATELEVQLQAAKAELAHLENELAAARGRREEVQEQLCSLKAEIASLRAQLSSTVETTDTVVADLTARVSELEAAQELQRELVLCVHQLSSQFQVVEETELEAEVKLAESSFSVAAEAFAAAKAVPDYEKAMQSVAEYEARFKQIEATYLKLASKQSLIGNLPAEAALKSLLSKLSTGLEIVREQAIHAVNQLATQQQNFRELKAQLSLIEKQEATTGYLRRLAELAAGAKTEKGVAIPLSTWVLIERFEAVIAAANPFISKFSNGRFKLIRVDEDANSLAQHGGLGISVYDYETDMERPSKTLSGGETFYVSLALALGLAEVVSAEAGGIDFKSMLIDEGFGTLDPETLDKVLEGIKQINHAGRTVGIVSHVEELRRRISDGIEVLPDPAGGSKLRIYS